MLVVQDVAASVKFYTDVLGFALMESWPNDQEPMWASLELNNQRIMLGGLAEADDPQSQGPDGQFFVECSDDFKKAVGGGVLLYFSVADVDAYHKQVTARGAKPLTEPTDQFYGIRDFFVRDLDGYRFAFNMPIQMTSCQACGMPLSDAKEGQMYCHYCVDEKGHLKPYEQILEGTIQGYFMGMQKMERGPAEVAAKEMLATMPAWMCRESIK
jgi:catechol 2,3-dioxygenase-like lactoylglutathione lyase family enzyme